jgi:uncharacterized membrane protein
VDRSRRWHTGLIILTLAYPLTHFIVQYIPNPFVPSANIALNMIFPILAGYLYGPISGAMAGFLGTGLSALLGPDMYDAMSILPHTLMGAAAGLAGASRSQFPAALTILIGHALNILFYWRFDLLVIGHINTLLLGLVTESTIGVVAITLLIVLLQKWLYQEQDQRW